LTIVSSKRLCSKCKRKKPFKEFCIFCRQKTTTNISIEIGETIHVRESFRARVRRQGFKKFIFETLQGWFPSGNPKIKDGVTKTRIINKEKDTYFERVENHKTGEVLRNCEEKLNNHRKR